jgi:tetratricopeptide (TPR) repeat protein
VNCQLFSTLTIRSSCLALLSIVCCIPAHGQVSQTSLAPPTNIPIPIPINKREAKAHHNRAVDLANAGQIDAAIEEDSKAMSANPDNAGYCILMARLLTERGQLQSALNIYEDVYERFPRTRDDIAELVVGLRSTITFLRVDEALSHAGSSDTPAKPSSETYPNKVADERTTGVVPSDQSRRQKRSTVHSVINRLMSSGLPIDDPLY